MKLSLSLDECLEEEKAPMHLRDGRGRMGRNAFMNNDEDEEFPMYIKDGGNDINENAPIKNTVHKSPYDCCEKYEE